MIEKGGENTRCIFLKVVSNVSDFTTLSGIAKRENSHSCIYL